MVRVVVAARTNRVSARLPVIVSDYLIGYLLSGDGRRPPCHWDLLASMRTGLLSYLFHRCDHDLMLVKSNIEHVERESDSPVTHEVN